MEKSLLRVFIVNTISFLFFDSSDEIEDAIIFLVRGSCGVVNAFLGSLLGGRYNRSGLFLGSFLGSGKLEESRGGRGGGI